MPHVAQYYLNLLVFFFFCKVFSFTYQYYHYFFRVNKKVYSPPHIGQIGCPNLIPGLTARPVWYCDNSSDAFPCWLKHLEGRYTAVRQEFLSFAGATSATDSIKFQVS